MKKFVNESFFFTIFFTIFFIFINILYLGIIAATDWDFRKRIESLRFDNPDFELIVLGASTALDGIDTKLLTQNGTKSFNLALAGNTVRTSYIQLSEYLMKYSKKPKYILLGLNSYGEDFYRDDIQPIVEVTMKNHNYNLNDMPILKFKWLGFEFLKKIISIKHRTAIVSYGQLKTRKNVPDNTNFDVSYLNIQKFESSRWIGEIARLCKQNGIELLLLELPGYKKSQNLSDFGPYTLQFNNGYSSVLYNYNNQDFCTIFDANKDWIAESHLNEFGAVKLTNELNKILKNQGTIPDIKPEQVLTERINRTNYMTHQTRSSNAKKFLTLY